MIQYKKIHRYKKNRKLYSTISSRYITSEQLLEEFYTSSPGVGVIVEEYETKKNITLDYILRAIIKVSRDLPDIQEALVEHYRGLR